MLRFTTNVTRSPAWRRRSSSAATARANKSRPRTVASVIPSSTETSPPSRAPPRIRRTSGEAQFRTGAALPGSPVLMAFLDEAVIVHERAHAGPQGLGQKLGPPGEFRIDRQPLAQNEAVLLGGAPQLGDEGPGRFGVDVIERQRRDAAPVVEPGGQQARIR